MQIRARANDGYSRDSEHAIEEVRRVKSGGSRAWGIRTVSASARKEREACATEKGERERETLSSDGGRDEKWLALIFRAHGEHRSTRSAAVPLFFNHPLAPLLPLWQPSAPSRSPLLHTLFLTLLPFRRRATATQTRTFRSNSISNQQPINWFEFGIQSGRLPPDVPSACLWACSAHTLSPSPFPSPSIPFAVFFPFRLVSRFKAARALATIEQLGFFFTWNRGTSDRDTTRGEGFYGSIDVRGLNNRASLKTKNCVV